MNKRYYAVISYPIIAVLLLLILNLIRVFYNTYLHGLTTDNITELIAWGIVTVMFVYAVIAIIKKRVYIELQEDQVFYKGLFHIEKSASYHVKCEAKSGSKNRVKKISFFDEKDLHLLTIKRYAFKDIDEIYLEIKKRST